MQVFVKKDRKAPANLTKATETRAWHWNITVKKRE